MNYIIKYFYSIQPVIYFFFFSLQCFSLCCRRQVLNNYKIQRILLQAAIRLATSIDAGGALYLHGYVKSRTIYRQCIYVCGFISVAHSLQLVNNAIIRRSANVVTLFGSNLIGMDNRLRHEPFRVPMNLFLFLTLRPL